MPVTPPRGQSTASDNQKRVLHYFAVVEYCTNECAEAQAERQDVFLWNARRAAEGVIYALAEGTEHAVLLHKLNNSDRKQLNLADVSTKLCEAGRLHDSTLKYLGIMRSTGNLGAHAQSPDKVADAQSLRSCAVAICEVVRWLYRESPLAREMPPAVEVALDHLDPDTPPRKSKHQQLREEFAELRKRHEILEQLHERLRRDHKLGVPERGPSPASRWPLWGGLAALVAFGAGAAVGWVVWSSEPPLQVAKESAAGIAAAVGPTGASAAAVAPLLQPTITPEFQPVAVTPPAPMAEPQVVAAPVPEVPPGCPEGTTVVSAAELRLATGPSPRPTWPKAAGPMHPQPVARFCMDDRPILVESLERSADATRTAGWPAPHPQSNQALGARGMPVNYVAWAEAERYCAAVGARLPTVAEWESAVRTGIRLNDRTDEWAADAFPAAVFGYAPDQLDRTAAKPRECLYHKGLVVRPAPRGPRLSWNRRGGDKRGLPSISFRCAWEPRP